MATLIQGSLLANNDWVRAYATNIIGLTGINPANKKYVLQIYNRLGTVKLADIRVSPNNQNNAFIDIAYVLQAQVGSKPRLNINFEGSLGFLDGLDETESIQVYIGEEDSSGNFTINSIFTNIKIWRAKVNDESMAWQPVHANPVNTFGDYPYSIYSFVPPFIKEGDWANSDEKILNPYLPAISGGPFNCTFIQEEAAPLTDFRYYKPAGELVGIPETWNSTLLVLVQKITKNRLGKLPLRTVSILNGVYREEIAAMSPPLSNVDHCAGYFITQYNGSTLLSSQFEDNSTFNGGGPNQLGYLLPGAPFGRYSAIHATIYDNMMTLSPDCTHFYIHFVVATGTNCIPAGVEPVQILNQPAWYPVRYDIETACADYSPMTVRWLNSSGGFDYFQFNKKHEETTTVDRNTFRSNKFDFWDAAAVTSDMILNDRGEKVYSQRIQKEIKMTTDWLYDYEAEFLESLFKSAEVSYIDQDQTYGVNQVEQVIQATITNKKLTEKSYRRNKLFQFEITLKDAYNIQSQRG